MELIRSGPDPENKMRELSWRHFDSHHRDQAYADEVCVLLDILTGGFLTATLYRTVYIALSHLFARVSRLVGGITIVGVSANEKARLRLLMKAVFSLTF